MDTIFTKQLTRKEFILFIVFAALGFSALSWMLRYFFPSTQLVVLAAGTYGAGSYGKTNF